jgi:hypothetical protein
VRERGWAGGQGREARSRASLLLCLRFLGEPVCTRPLARMRQFAAREAATSKAHPRQQQDWILKCLQGG